MHSRLNIQRNVSINHIVDDFTFRYPNPCGLATFQHSIGGRETENEAIARMAWGDQHAPTNATLYLNGQIVDLDRMLMCSRCHLWKADEAFDRERRLDGTLRRGRRYYCKSCRSKSNLFEMPVIDEKTQARLIKGSKRKKRKNK